MFNTSLASILSPTKTHKPYLHTTHKHRELLLRAACRPCPRLGAWPFFHTLPVPSTSASPSPRQPRSLAAIMKEEKVPQDTTTTVVHTESNGHDDQSATHHHQDDAAVAEQDRLTMAQQEEIEAQIAATQKLIGDLEPPSVLVPAYKDNPAQGFVAGVEDLARRYRMMRRVRGDGNCFYRAFLFAYLAALVEGGVGEGGGRKGEWEALTKTVKESKAWLVEVGYEEIAIDTFWEVFVEELEELPTKALADLEATFNDPHGVASYMVWYCRLLTAGFLKKHREEYEAFLDGSYSDINDFCAREVEPVGKECEQVQVMALMRALGVRVHIEYLDGRPLPEGGHLPFHVLPEGGGEEGGEGVVVTLLYRPGHYDVLAA